MVRIGRRFVVRGRVQGVGFRYFVMVTAQELSITGTVRNAADGSVEVIAEGTKSAIVQLTVSLKRGPAGAHVAEVHETQMEVTGGYRSFQVIY